jgi:DNA repair exonuclease SbcCD ATPase subunit
VADARDETIEQLQQEIEAALEEREKLRQELQEEVREFQRQFDEVKNDLRDVDSRLDEQIKTFKQTFEAEKKSLETKDANIVKKMERLETVKAGGVGGGVGLFGDAPLLAPLAALSAVAFFARRESILKRREEKARQEAAAKAKQARQPTSAIVTVRLPIISVPRSRRLSLLTEWFSLHSLLSRVSLEWV